MVHQMRKDAVYFIERPDCDSVRLYAPGVSLPKRDPEAINPTSNTNKICRVIVKLLFLSEFVNTLSTGTANYFFYSVNCIS